MEQQSLTAVASWKIRKNEQDRLLFLRGVKSAGDRLPILVTVSQQKNAVNDKGIHLDPL